MKSSAYCGFQQFDFRETRCCSKRCYLGIEFCVGGFV